MTVFDMGKNLGLHKNDVLVNSRTLEVFQIGSDPRPMTSEEIERHNRLLKQPFYIWDEYDDDDSLWWIDLAMKRVF